MWHSASSSSPSLSSFAFSFPFSFLFLSFSLSLFLSSFVFLSPFCSSIYHCRLSSSSSSCVSHTPKGRFKVTSTSCKSFYASYYHSSHIQSHDLHFQSSYFPHPLHTSRVQSSAALYAHSAPYPEPGFSLHSAHPTHHAKIAHHVHPAYSVHPLHPVLLSLHLPLSLSILLCNFFRQYSTLLTLTLITIMQLTLHILQTFASCAPCALCGPTEHCCLSLFFTAFCNLSCDP